MFSLVPSDVPISHVPLYVTIKRRQIYYLLLPLTSQVLKLMDIAYKRITFTNWTLPYTPHHSPPLNAYNNSISHSLSVPLKDSKTGWANYINTGPISSNTATAIDMHTSSPKLYTPSPSRAARPSLNVRSCCSSTMPWEWITQRMRSSIYMHTNQEWQSTPRSQDNVEHHGSSQHRKLLSVWHMDGKETGSQGDG